MDDEKAKFIEENILQVAKDYYHSRFFVKNLKTNWKALEGQRCYQTSISGNIPEDTDFVYVITSSDNPGDSFRGWSIYCHRDRASGRPITG